MDLLPILQSLKSDVDQIAIYKQTSDNNEQIQELYMNSILPNLLQLRKINRIEKNHHESKNNRIRDLNKTLTSLQHTYDCLAFEASCLNPRVIISDAEALRGVDHETRMKCLDEEEDKRKNLQEKLAQLTAETKDLESLYSASSNELKSVKPYVVQLLDKLGPKIM